MSQTSLPSAKQQIVWLDVIRFAAMFMVACSHCCDPFNISPQAKVNPDYQFWGAVYGSMLRACVPLFTMITGALLLPIREKTSVFYKKRIPRILFPFLIWSVLYNLFPWFTGVIGLPPQFITTFFGYAGETPSQTFTDAWHNISLIPLKFSVYAVHMWYIYMLFGLYLYMPIFSAWIEKASEKAKLGFLAVWGVTLFIPYIREFLSSDLLGACSWNEFSLLYTFAGFNGYLLLGHYLAKGIKISTPKLAVLSAISFAVGYFITFKGFRFMTAMPDATEPQIELFFTFCSINVLLMTAPMFLMMQRINISSDFVKRQLANLSKCGFGVYMIHYFFVGPSFMLVDIMHVPLAAKIPVAAVFAFFGSWIVIRLLYKLPKMKWMLG